jgi:hypothetical protein
LRAWREANPEEYKKGKHDEYMKHRAKYRENGKQWYVNNKEQVHEQGKRWRAKNKELKAERDKAYKLANPERCRAKQSEWWKLNKERLRTHRGEYKKRLRETNEEYAMACRLRERVRTAIKNAAKSSKTKILVGCSMEFLRGYLEARFTEGMTWELFLAGKIHIDHIRPCASFDLTDPVQQRICFNYRNLQPLWAVDNLRKNDRWDSSDINIWANKSMNDLLLEIQCIQYKAV